MFSIRTHLVISGALFLALIGLPLMAAVLQRTGVSPPTGTARCVVAGVYLLIFVAMIVLLIFKPNGLFGKPWG